MVTIIVLSKEFEGIQQNKSTGKSYTLYRFKNLQCRQQNWMIMKMQFEAEAPQQAVSLSKDLTWLPLSRWAESLKGSTQHHLSQHSFKLPSSRTEIKEIEIILRLFLVIAMCCQGSSSQIISITQPPPLRAGWEGSLGTCSRYSNSLETTYRTRAIITRGLYSFYPLFEVQKVSRLFLATYCLYQGFLPS